MRLKKIKLAGFKSFVDPTTVQLPSNLVGIVGPNGCGKSNIIDAVRWVMGESSAKHLRGDSMADVIFNGSTARKPVGQAFIELVFDNADGQLGARYAHYNEVAVKRQVSRDGQSAYYLNGTRCRRRDITDIFLGTGLGPRSYAIIEQGMISRLIEARPEDLRIFLEEAAGISKYKERRRETETRIGHTRENLDRLNDLREELGKQLHHLQRQARAAEKYKELKQEERLLRAQLQALHWRTLDQAARAQQQVVQELETELEAHIARQRALDAEMERLRAQHIDAGDQLNGVQGRYYGLGADISRVEQSIQHARERRQELQADLERVEQGWQEAQAHQRTDSHRLEELQARLVELEPEVADSREAAQVSAAQLGEAEQSVHLWQTDWETFSRQAATATQGAEVERTRIQHLEQQLQNLSLRLKRLEEERDQLSDTGLAAEIAALEARHQELEHAGRELQLQLQGTLAAIGEQRQHNQHLSTELDTARNRLQKLRGRHASLEALQQAALGKREGAVVAWLKQHGLHQRDRLAETLNVDPGWERAVETVLGFNLEAVCVDGIGPLVGVLEGLRHGNLALFDTSVAAAAMPDAGSAAHPLGARVRAPWALEPLLGGILAVDSLPEALALRDLLAPHESVVTRDGVWLGRSWLRLARDPDERAGVLHREQELQTLQAEVERDEARVAGLAQALEDGRETLQRDEARRDALQREATQFGRQYAELRAQLSGKHVQQEQVRQRRERLETELEDARSQRGRDEATRAAAQAQLQVAVEEMAALEQQRELRLQRREELRQLAHELRQRAHEDRDRMHQVALETGALRTQLESTRRTLERMESQRQSLAERRQALTQQLLEGEAPLRLQEANLQELLERRLAVEKDLSAARQGVEALEHRLRELGVQRGGTERETNEARQRLDQGRLGGQELKVRRQTLAEQVGEGGYELEQLLAELPAAAEEGLWGEQLEGVRTRIQRLGPINLAAIDEFKTQQQRKDYLDAQHADLTEALATLENAIHKIDRETRTRFKETFDKVNAGLKAMFPRLFGGGHAYLELTGEDLLSSGVGVMARPPGKRNSTIHLLSGGEKALTAVALVFAIFELNPAPFCILDEVDAPLDDANVGRFCDLVREMSERVQFIYITHNKMTMEMAQHLTGVTMQEPGVSRLVAVDVAEAMQLAAV